MTSIIVNPLVGRCFTQLAAFDDHVTAHKISGVRDWWLAKSADERAAIEAEIADTKALGPDYVI